MGKVKAGGDPTNHEAHGPVFVRSGWCVAWLTAGELLSSVLHGQPEGQFAEGVSCRQETGSKHRSSCGYVADLSGCKKLQGGQEPTQCEWGPVSAIANYPRSSMCDIWGQVLPSTNATSSQGGSWQGRIIRHPQQIQSPIWWRVTCSGGSQSVWPFAWCTQPSQSGHGLGGASTLLAQR